MAINSPYPGMGYVYSPIETFDREISEIVYRKFVTNSDICKSENNIDDDFDIEDIDV